MVKEVIAQIVAGGADVLDIRGAGILEVWKNWATDIRGKGLECGHFIPEEAPDALTEELLAFFGA